MTRAALDDARVTFNVFDADFLSKTMIGSHSFEFSALYREPGHELWRTWVGLMDATHAADAGSLQGMLRVSVSVLGPGDALFIPPRWWHHVRALTPSASLSVWW